MSPSSSTPRFCGPCGGPLSERWVESEQRTRAVCSRCGAVAYRSPQLLVSTVVASGERLLLCKRAHPPAAGRWGLPGGFMECGETLEAAAARETFEETGVRLAPEQLRLHTLATLPELNEVYVGFFATLSEPPELACGSECLEVRFFDEATLPWAELTYPDVGRYLRRCFEERRAGERAIHFSRFEAVRVLRQTYRIADIEHVLSERTANGSGTPG